MPKGARIAIEVLFVAAVALLFFRAVRTGDLAAAAARITPAVLAAVVGFQAAILGLGTLCWGLILRRAGMYRGAWRCFGARLTGFAVTYLTPSASFGGVPARAELYREDGMDGGRLYATILLDTAVEVAGKVPSIMAGVLMLASRRSPPLVRVVLAAAPLALAGVLVAKIASRAALSPRSGSMNPEALSPSGGRPVGSALSPMARLLGKVRKFCAEIRQLSINGHTLAAATGIAVVIGLVEVLQTWFLLFVLGSGSLPDAFSIYSSIVVQGITGVLPGNIGGMEGAHAAVFTLLGMTPAASLVYTAMLRSGQLVAVLFGILNIPFRRLAQARGRIREGQSCPTGTRSPVASPESM